MLEKIYGNMAVVYHRTRASDLINHVYTSGFKPGTGDMYGKGFYSTYDLKSQDDPRMAATYGDIVVKFAVPIQNFMFFDFDQFVKSPQYKQIDFSEPDSEYNVQPYDNFIKKQMDYFGIPSDTEFYLRMEDGHNHRGGATSRLAQQLLSEVKLWRYVDGIVFTGNLDGKVLVSYNTDIIMPLSYRIDGEQEFHKVERNYTYLKKWSQAKFAVRDAVKETNLDDILMAIKNGKSDKTYEDYKDKIEGAGLIVKNDIHITISDGIFFVRDDAEMIDKYLIEGEFYETYYNELFIPERDLWEYVTDWAYENTFVKSNLENLFPDMDIDDILNEEYRVIRDDYPDEWNTLKWSYIRANEIADADAFYDDLYASYVSAIKDLGTIVSQSGIDIEVILDEAPFFEAIEYSKNMGYIEGDIDNDFVTIDEYLQEERPLELGIDWHRYTPLGVITADLYAQELEARMGI